jgi:hypothetical protein
MGMQGRVITWGVSWAPQQGCPGCPAAHLGPPARAVLTQLLHCECSKHRTATKPGNSQCGFGGISVC